MARYNYKCSKGCKLLDLARSIDVVDKDIYIQIDPKQDSNQLMVWEVFKSIKDESDIFCPICGSIAFQTFLNSDSIPGWIVKGRAYENKILNKIHVDKALLQENDPYSEWRQPGETEEVSKYLDKKIREHGGDRGASRFYKNVLSLKISEFLEWMNEEHNS
jgi:hypothetical protein